MSQTTAYNGIRAKQIDQINSQSGEAYAAYSAPDFFINDDSVFAAKRAGNRVNFFTTGDDYFKDLAREIAKAEQCIFITGWQVNYDVLLDGERTLWQCLYQALSKQPQLRVYVMPWLCPSSSLETYDIETMLAIFQLNAGLTNGPRAFCMPSIQRSDMNGLGVMFSQHQKSVVIDNKLGYVGGIDLAYGRRDDNNFSLSSADRSGNDAYNPCIPRLGWMELDKHVGRTGLVMAALFDLSAPIVPGPVNHIAPIPSRAQIANSANYILDVFQGPVSPPIAFILRQFNKVGDALETSQRAVTQLKLEFLERSIRLVAQLIKLTLKDMSGELKEQLEQWLRDLELAAENMTAALRIKSIQLIDLWISETPFGQVFALLSGASFDSLPASVVPRVSELAVAVLWYLHRLLETQAADNHEPYPYLLKRPQPLASHDNSCLAPDQPRMPWQDVHSSIRGPSVYDLSRNFIDRWNGQQASLADPPPPEQAAQVEKALGYVMEWLNLVLRQAQRPYFPSIRSLAHFRLELPPANWISGALLPRYPEPARGAASVQVLRSAAAQMLAQEQTGRQRAGADLPALPGFVSRGVQNNCESAMLQAISSAQDFIYIENQFFQSAHGAEGELHTDVPLSGPMASLRDPATLSQNLVRRVRLREALEARDIWKLDWVEIDAIGRRRDKESADFLEQLFGMWKINAQGWITHRLGDAQKTVSNGIGKALADRIGRAIDEGKPFHVYMILPVHPEGALNVPNIMHQVHLTMQSLVFGEQSLVKRIQRRMALRALLDKGVDPAAAARAIEQIGADSRPDYQRQDWSRYLTLLNLRTWDQLNGQVVTEQIYIHSKLLIADDRIAILGSANINDRSLLGTRDSELAVIVRDSTPITVALDGKRPQQVSKAVHELRVALWKKHFGLSMTKVSRVQPATGLQSCLDQPAAESSWRAIQLRARRNAEAYETAFDFIPRNTSLVQPHITPDMTGFQNGFPGSVWPTWAYRDLTDLVAGGDLIEPMPYEDTFWRGDIYLPPRAYAAPQGIQGFICQLPTQWTRGENNDSGLNLAMLAWLFRQKNGDVFANASNQQGSTT